MSTYSERLGQFNQAIDATNQHVETLKNTLNNKELRENPYKMGTELAGQVLGTTGGFIGIRNRISGDAEARRAQSAFFNRLGQVGNIQKDTSQGVGDALQKGLGSISDAQKSLASSINDFTNQNLRNVRSAGQSLGSQVADNGKTATNAVQNVRSGAVAPSNPAPTPDQLKQADGGLSDKISNVSNTSEANNVNRALNQKIASNFSSDEISQIQSKLPQTLVNRVNTANQVGARGDAFAQNVGQKLALNIKNNAINHSIASKNATGNLPDAFDEQGNGIYNTPTRGASNLTSATSSASADASGIASTGSNASKTVASATGGTPSSSLPHGGSASAGSATDLNPVAGLADDTTTAAAAAPAADAGSAIAQRAQALRLQVGRIPASSGQGTIKGLTSASTADTSSGAAHLVSQAQGADTLQHTLAQAPGSQVTADVSKLPAGASTDAQQGANAAKTAMTGMGGDGSSLLTAGGSKASAVADDAGNGIKTALGVEGTLDELAPEAGPLGPVLEAGSLLATLGTSIAGLFEKPKEEDTGPTGPAPQTLQIGANLKNDASGSVGAF